MAFAGASSGYSFDAVVLPSANDAAALGSATVSWSDAFFASGGVLNFNNGDVTITHAANALAFAGATTNGYSFADGPIKPAANDGAALGVSGTAWSDLYVASGGIIDFAAGNVVLTHSSGVLTLGTGDLRITTAGTNAASAVTVGGTQTLTNKTLTTPAFSGTPSGIDASTTAKGISEFATAAEYRTGTDTARSIVVSEVWASTAVVSLTDAATIAVDMSTFINASVVLGGNRTLGNPTNPKVGQSGFILLVQDGTGGRTVTFASNWKFAGAVDPVLSTAAAENDFLFYTVINSSFIAASLMKGVN
ncbi:hypothetical protein ACHMW7_16240 [Aminobacter sp. UC22_36]|uniref:hypothetical protein n=1 Tax=Aminobacter sp. UC22_36 TaxID=3374549 RepID=UPI003757C556